MTTYDFVHLVLHACGDRIEGRTKLQKTVYFVGALAGMQDGLGYRAHYYGPYSADVAGAIGDLRGLGFLDQNIRSRGAIDSAGFEVSRYDYTLTEGGKQVAEEKTKEHPAEWDRIKAAVATLKAANEEDYVKLSIAAKAKYLIEQKGQQQQAPVTEAQLLELMPQFGWHVTKEQLQEAGRFLSKLRTI